jgi:hypothetical protein
LAGTAVGVGVAAASIEAVRLATHPRFDMHARVLEGYVRFLASSATAENSHAHDGVETFVVCDGEIVLQTVHHTAQPGARAAA